MSVFLFSLPEIQILKYSPNDQPTIKRSENSIGMARNQLRMATFPCDILLLLFFLHIFHFYEWVFLWKSFERPGHLSDISMLIENKLRRLYRERERERKIDSLVCIDINIFRIPLVLFFLWGGSEMRIYMECVMGISRPTYPVWIARFFSRFHQIKARRTREKKTSALSIKYLFDLISFYPWGRGRGKKLTRVMRMVFVLFAPLLTLTLSQQRERERWREVNL